MVLWFFSVALLLLASSPSLVVADGPVIEQRQSTNYASPDYYPAPKGGWVSDWSAAYQKAQAMVSKMTLAEKVNVTTGTGVEMVCRSLCYLPTYTILILPSFSPTLPRSCVVCASFYF